MIACYQLCTICVFNAEAKYSSSNLLIVTVIQPLRGSLFIGLPRWFHQRLFKLNPSGWVLIFSSFIDLNCLKAIGLDVRRGRCDTPVFQCAGMGELLSELSDDIIFGLELS